MRTYLISNVTLYDKNDRVTKQKVYEHINYKDINKILKIYAVYGDVGRIEIVVEKKPIDN